ncbi:MAG TPA: hypothetical protein VF184_09610, partial [Phycisphaeraceae bacterium]
HQPLGPTCDNPIRLGDLIQARQDQLLLSLENFVVLTRIPTEQPQQINAVYAQAWALFRYLFIHHRPAMVKYLTDLAQQPPGSRSAWMLKAEFETAFGPVGELEPAWLAYLDELTGPFPAQPTED